MIHAAFMAELYHKIARKLKKWQIKRKINKKSKITAEKERFLQKNIKNVEKPQNIKESKKELRKKRGKWNGKSMCISCGWI